MHPKLFNLSVNMMDCFKGQEKVFVISRLIKTDLQYKSNSLEKISPSSPSIIPYPTTIPFSIVCTMQTQIFKDFCEKAIYDLTQIFITIAIFPKLGTF